jgi:hypothetical protein
MDTADHKDFSDPFMGLQFFRKSSIVIVPPNAFKNDLGGAAETDTTFPVNIFR